MDVEDEELTAEGKSSRGIGVREKLRKDQSKGVFNENFSRK